MGRIILLVGTTGLGMNVEVKPATRSILRMAWLSRSATYSVLPSLLTAMPQGVRKSALLRVMPFLLP